MKNEEKLELLRHSMSHVMAAAILELWPEAKFAIGPSIDTGFYYDIDFGEVKIGEEDLSKIEKKMKYMIKQGLPFERFELKIEEAIKREKKAEQPYKVELLEDLKKEGEKTVSYYRLGKFEDLCRGPHLEKSSKITPGSFKLVKLAGAYWRGDEKREMLTRIYGAGFESKKDLDDYLEMMKEAEKRNHIKLGRELDLFSMHEEGPGFPFFHPRGMIIWQQMMAYWKEEHNREDYKEIRTPIILRRELWEQSGHWEHYRENMYFTKIDDRDFAVKPMNCPGGMLVYKNNRHSYREFPIKIAEVGLVHRHELSGTLNGLFRVRSFNQDDAHIYCTQEQIKNEVVNVISLIDRIYKTYGLKYHMELSTRPEKAIGDKAVWDRAETALSEALKEAGGDYKLNPGDGAFYGPKIDFHVYDALNRTWQCGTIQLDFSMPERFDLEYAAADGKMHRPVMLHRTVYGAIERFMGILIEHYAGSFPLWLSPVQAKLVVVSEKHVDYCDKLAQEFRDQEIRVEVDRSDESVGKKIRNAVKEKVPYMLVIGDKEVNSDNLHIRDRGSEKVREIAQKEFVNEIKDKIAKKIID